MSSGRRWTLFHRCVQIKTNYNRISLFFRSMISNASIADVDIISGAIEDISDASHVCGGFDCKARIFCNNTLICFKRNGEGCIHCVFYSNSLCYLFRLTSQIRVLEVVFWAEEWFR